MAWAGMRGGESLAAALAVPLAVAGGDPFPQRSLSIFLTFAVIVATLVSQGLTLPWLIPRLGLAGRETVLEREMALGQRATTRVALARLEQARAQGSAPEDVVNRLRARYEHRLRDLRGPVSALHEARDAAAQRLRRELLATERDEAIRLRDEGLISDDVLHRTQRDLDLEEVQLREE